MRLYGCQLVVLAQLTSMACHRLNIDLRTLSDSDRDRSVAPLFAARSMERDESVRMDPRGATRAEG